MDIQRFEADEPCDTFKEHMKEIKKQPRVTCFDIWTFSVPVRPTRRESHIIQPLKSVDSGTDCVNLTSASNDKSEDRPTHAAKESFQDDSSGMGIAGAVERG